MLLSDFILCAIVAINMSPITGTIYPTWANKSTSIEYVHQYNGSNITLCTQYNFTEHTDQLLSGRLFATTNNTNIYSNIESIASEHNDKVSGNDFEWVRAPNIHTRLEYSG